MRTGVIERLTSLPVSPRWSIQNVANPCCGSLRSGSKITARHGSTWVSSFICGACRVIRHSPVVSEIGLPDSPIDGIVPFWPTSFSFRPSDAMMPVLLFMPASDSWLRSQ